jgi:hypothetical protein
MEEAPLRLACAACGLARAFPPGRAPGSLPSRCPRCGGPLAAEGLLSPVEPAPVLTASERALLGLPDSDAPAPRTAPRAGRALAAPGALEVALLAAGAALLAWSHLTRGFLAAVVAGFDLVVHEAGHPIFGLLGSRFLMFLGGTLAQLAIPAAAAVAFALRRRAVPLGAALAWLGFNLVDVGRYAADAQARALPLLAADASSHDWWNLLGMLGVRHHCGAIGGAIGAAGWLLWAGAPAWAAWRWLRARPR